MLTLDVETWKLIGKVVSGVIVVGGIISGIIIAWRRLRREEKKEESRVYKPTPREVDRYSRGKEIYEFKRVGIHTNLQISFVIAAAALLWLLFQLFRWLFK